MLQFFDNLFHYKNIVTVQWIKRLKLCMITMVTLPPAKELKIQVVSWQNEIRTLDVLNCPTWSILFHFFSQKTILVLASSVEPDEMTHNVAFLLGLHCLPKYEFGPTCLINLGRVLCGPSWHGPSSR